MRVATIAREDDFDGWRAAARTLALAGVAPADIVWQVGERSIDLFADQPADGTAPAGAFSVPRAFVDLARTALCHRDPERFALLYTLLVRLRATPALMDDAADPLMRRIDHLARDVRRDMHKMRAFVRFREVAVEGAEPRYVAWFEPDNHIVRINADFFARRFATMRWSILTPGLSVHWDGDALAFAPGATRADAPDGDPIEETWKTYYASIFNPARIKIGAMTKEMPRKYWKNMPETALVAELIAGAQQRESRMIDTAHAEIGGNARLSWDALRTEAAGCTRCSLYAPATQTVFGEGPVDARMMIVGEQPGDNEDLAGRPFVGPAGRLFDRAMAAAGIDRATLYLTNAVKHFKFEQRGKRRIHATPRVSEVDACRWWVEQERVLVRPAVTVALGTTAARSLTGRTVTISKVRGAPVTLADGGECWITVHPSYLLRLPDPAQAEDEYARFVEDLRTAHARIAALAPA